jgi:CheY-like chemotaxis protein
MPAAPSTVITAHHLLLVDDDVDMRELVAESLRATGYEVEEAGDGRGALAAILGKRPSLLITDCNMPNMTGNQLVDHLFRDACLCSLPVIVVSAAKQPPLPPNVVAFFAKPFTMAKLEAAIRDSLATTSS